MAHLSRPFQVALAAICVLAAVWLVALRGHSSSNPTSSSVPAPQPSSSSGGSASSTPSTGSAPGVAGLTRAIEKARGAVALSEANAKQLAEKSAQASSPSGSGAPTASSTSGGAGALSKPAGTHTAASGPSHASTRTHTRSSASSRSHTPPTHTRAATPAAHPVASPSAQQRVEAELKQGKIVAILVWDPHALVDQVAHNELESVVRAQHGRVAVIAASANQVGSFGSFTRAVQVYGTPTILFINRRGQTSSLSGLTDTYSLEQAISEAKR
ncbi:MAG TPA: hypothetical protein VNZ05_08575 [Solirubrobacteraceae bacterium]|nr:hypothetical protein [Solirubrobacteraceae bacterium]